jgi:hypothetical protein
MKIPMASTIFSTTPCYSTIRDGIDFVAHTGMLCLRVKIIFHVLGILHRRPELTANFSMFVGVIGGLSVSIRAGRRHTRATEQMA